MGKSKKTRQLVRAAKMEKPFAMYRLGVEYQLGKKLHQDMEKACFWITKAAGCGNTEALEWLKDYHFDDNAEIQADS